MELGCPTPRSGILGHHKLHCQPWDVPSPIISPGIFLVPLSVLGHPRQKWQNILNWDVPGYSPWDFPNGGVPEHKAGGRRFAQGHICIVCAYKTHICAYNSRVTMTRLCSGRCTFSKRHEDREDIGFEDAAG
ncbi:hypothetical protein K435DRAFT_813223 [Dendrothele bispora CBS 962.96]|uniref:Uncharacterized protein n=1 Tax=Dendrothele bispora (strain CBS 962.96) TaxID=1314807 RepID=A0A4S8KLZ2_DENBC|nr:hypothetical protein K435DRAFT_813223 [Dendrothele bispora CBS 962.96]